MRLDSERPAASITSIQPGGGVCMRAELYWGGLRRWYLKTFRRSYIARMRQLRKREPIGCPHEVLDPRDLKFHRNRTGDCWDAADDPFRWRDRLPFARAGLFELLAMSGPFFVLGMIAARFYWPLAIPLLGLAGFFVWFFRDPERRIPTGSGIIVSPADGKIVAIDPVEHHPFIDGPAVVVGIFLSVFNVHINRAPAKSHVIGLTYLPGKFLNALRPISARENECMIMRLQGAEEPFRKYEVRQIAGALARRIVCQVGPGDQLAAGERFGMIKLGSRTELVLPADQGLSIQVSLGQNVKGGSSTLAVYR